MNLDLLNDLKGAMSQIEFAELLGVSQPTICAILRGRRGIGKKTLKGLLRAFPDRKQDIISNFFV
jgi:transcriptional regulator with XRE-family HTH domain